MTTAKHKKLWVSPSSFCCYCYYYYHTFSPSHRGYDSDSLLKNTSDSLPPPYVTQQTDAVERIRNGFVVCSYSHLCYKMCV